MASRTTLKGALLLAAPFFLTVAWAETPWTDPLVKAGAKEPSWFQLTEDRQQVGKLLGKPVLVTESGADFYSWQYQTDSINEDYSHYAVFRKADGKLISITRQYEPERNVDMLFPTEETLTCFFPDKTTVTFAARVRRLSGGRLLIAMGSAKPGQKTGQLLLIREAEVGHFYPWVAAQMTSLSKP